MKNVLYLDGASLKLEDLYSILEGNLFEVKILERELEQPESALFMQRDAFEPVECDGDFLPKEIGMLSLLLLLNQSIRYQHVLSADFTERTINYINNGIYPCIHKMNKTEQSAMSELALVLSGDDTAICYYDGEYTSVERALRAKGLNKYRYSKAEITFITKLCCMSTSMAIAALKQAEKLAKTADICVAMNLEAIRGETGAFDKRLHELARPYPNQIISAENIRSVIAGSQFTTDEARIAYGGDHGPRCQDAICIRAVPQTHGGVRDTIQWLKKNLKIEINADFHKVNPIIGYSIDLMIIALTDLGSISERRSFRLTDTSLSYGLPMNLVGENPGFNHGFPVVQAAATAILGELKLLSMPCTSYSAIDPIDKEYICTTYSAALKTIDVISLLNKILAVEMLMAAQAMDLAKDKLADFRFGTGSKAALQEFRKYVKTTRANRFAAPDMVEADRIVNEEKVLAAVENAIGKLM